MFLIFYLLGRKYFLVKFSGKYILKFFLLIKVENRFKWSRRFEEFFGIEVIVILSRILGLVGKIIREEEIIIMEIFFILDIKIE